MSKYIPRLKKYDKRLILIGCIINEKNIEEFINYGHSFLIKKNIFDIDARISIIYNSISYTNTNIPTPGYEKFEYKMNIRSFIRKYLHSQLSIIHFDNMERFKTTDKLFESIDEKLHIEFCLKMSGLTSIELLVSELLLLGQSVSEIAKNIKKSAGYVSKIISSAAKKIKNLRRD